MPDAMPCAGLSVIDRCVDTFSGRVRFRCETTERMMGLVLVSESDEVDQ